MTSDRFTDKDFLFLKEKIFELAGMVVERK